MGLVKNYRFSKRSCYKCFFSIVIVTLLSGCYQNKYFTDKKYVRNNSLENNEPIDEEESPKPENEKSYASNTVETINEVDSTDIDILIENYHLSEAIQDESGIIVNRKLSKELINMLITHFKAMDEGDIESFKTTLAPEDGGDTYSEPYAMGTFEHYKNTGVYIKEVRIYIKDDVQLALMLEEEYIDLAPILEITVRNPKDNEDASYWAVISYISECWGISRYVPKSQI